MNLKSQIESLLFLSPKPVAVKKLAEVTGGKKEEIKTILEGLKKEYDERGGGVSVIDHQGSYQMSTSAENSEMVRNFLKDEQLGELTKPGLETLTIIAYRGPLTKAELEQIRGVNCGLILRNLMMRGLVKEVEDPANLLPTYEVTMDYLRHLGLNNLQDLPDYDKLHNHENIVNTLTPPVNQ